MNAQPMSETQQSDAAWALAPGQVVRLAIGREARQLRVVDGWLWLTTTGTADQPPEDVWLLPGEPMHLPARTEWVVEARSSGRFQLLVPPEASAWQAWRAKAAWWLAGFRPLPPRGLRA